MVCLIEVIELNKVTKRDRYVYINASTIVAARPNYAVQASDGKWWRCEPDHDEAKVLSFHFELQNGMFCNCSNEGELAKIGLTLQTEVNKSPIGFIWDKNGTNAAF